MKSPAKKKSAQDGEPADEQPNPDLEKEAPATEFAGENFAAEPAEDLQDSQPEAGEQLHVQPRQGSKYGELLFGDEFSPS